MVAFTCPQMRSFVALFIAVLATSVFATSGPITVPLKKVQHSGTYLNGSSGIRARAAFTSSGLTTTLATNLDYVQYTVEVDIGNPPISYNLAVDTGSCNTFVGTGKSYVRTDTSIFTGQDVNITFGEGFFSGLEYVDQVTIAPGVVITNQSIGDALHWADFPGVDGLIAYGPVDLTRGTLSPNVNETVPTVTNNLVSQGLLEHEIVSISFAPSASDSDTNGAMTYGGVDSTLYNGDITYTPVTKTLPAGKFWGINVTSVTYGPLAVIPTSHAGIIDSGSTLIIFADVFFDVYKKAIPGAKLNDSTGLLEIPPTSVSSMHSLDFMISGRVFSMDVASQIMSNHESVGIGLDPEKRYSVVTNFGNASTLGLNYILGQKFMERFYVVFDTESNRVGFAETNYTFSKLDE